MDSHVAPAWLAGLLLLELSHHLAGDQDLLTPEAAEETTQTTQKKRPNRQPGPGTRCGGKAQVSSSPPHLSHP